MSVAVTETRLAAGHYYGEVGGRFASALATLSEVVHEGARSLPEHDHACAYFCMLVDGDYRETIGSRELAYSPFVVGFHPARMPHRDVVGPRGGRFLCVEITALALDETGARLRNNARLLPSAVTVELVRLYRHFHCRTLSSMVVDSVVWELCGDVAVESSPRERAVPAWMLRSLEIVEDEKSDAITVASIAQRVGVHPVHLSREFRRRFGQTLGEYAHKVRIREACARIARRRESLASIAASAGFADQSHFCRVFKAQVGCTPSAYVQAVGARRH